MTDIPSPTVHYRKHGQGWLSPDGLYYPCASAAEHYSVACALLAHFYPRISRQIQQDYRAREDDALQQRGWIRVGAMMSYNYGFVIWKKPKQKQLDVIWDYCRMRRQTMPSLEII